MGGRLPLCSSRAEVGYLCTIPVHLLVQADEPAWHVRPDTTQGIEAGVQQALVAIEVGRAEGD